MINITIYRLGFAKMYVGKRSFLCLSINKKPEEAQNISVPTWRALPASIRAVYAVRRYIAEVRDDPFKMLEMERGISTNFNLFCRAPPPTPPSPLPVRAGNTNDKYPRTA